MQDRVRQPSARLVVDGHSRERCKPPKEPGQIGTRPGQVQMGRQARRNEQVDRSCSEHLVRDADPIRPSDIPRLGRLHDASLADVEGDDESRELAQHVDGLLHNDDAKLVGVPDQSDGLERRCNGRRGHATLFVRYDDAELAISRRRHNTHRGHATCFRHRRGLLAWTSARPRSARQAEPPGRLRGLSHPQVEAAGWRRRLP